MSMTQNLQYPVQAFNQPIIPFNVAQTVNYISTTANNLASSSRTSKRTSAFRAPAHKHAHHLHSIPPREKSTRTLIIDHMLWVHGRTRFAQTRAELGMTDRTGGPSSPNYVNRQRPESYEEDDEVGSDGEAVEHLKTRAGGSGQPPADDEDERLRKQDLSLARSLRLRAEGLEKVVTSMLEQPPKVHPMHDEEITTPPTSPKLDSLTGSHPHTLPNGVRLRLSLGTMINDFFARQAPPPPYRHQHHTGTSSNTGNTAQASTSCPDLPPTLASLCPISLPSRYLSRHSSGSDQSIPPSPSPTQQNLPIPSPRVRSLYTVGADPDTANAPPALRCPRHLHTGCEICVEAKSSMKLGMDGGANRQSSSSGNDTARLNQTRNWKGMSGTGPSTAGGGITGWQDGSGIGSGLARPDVGGSVLRRKPAVNTEGNPQGTGAGSTKLSELIPRFLRLSALVSMELGREVADDDDSGSLRSRETDLPESSASSDRSWDNEAERQSTGDLSLLPSPSSPSTARAIKQAQDKLYAYCLRPSREWYLLLAGLLTRAVLQGYLTAGWRGLEVVECLLTVGLGISDDGQDIHNRDGRDRVKDPDKIFEEFDPDDLPSLMDTVKIMFPSLRSGVSVSKSPAEAEYELEMIDRMRRFYDIPASTPDLSTHMEDLAWQYPAEPVERAAVRFCEAIAKWRGKPELENYKKRTTGTQPEGTADGGMLSMDSFVRSNPTSPTTVNAMPPGRPIPAELPSMRKPSIEKFFLPLTGANGLGTPNLWNRNKRTRSPDNLRSPSKRPHV